MRVTLSQPLISCTRRISTPYSSPASMNVKYCSLLSADRSAPAVAFVVLMIQTPQKSTVPYNSPPRRRGPPAALRGVRRHFTALLGHRANEVGDVDDQCHRAVAEDGRACDTRDRLEIRLEALDDNLLLRQKV